MLHLLVEDINMQTGLIYIATNKLNGKQYVGQTIQPLNKRIASHIRKKKQTHFDSALNQHGLENFYIFKIEYPKEELNDWEKYYIEILDTFNTPNGYNHTSGGDVFEVSDITRKKQSIAKSGEKHPMFGKHPSEETVKNMSVAQSGEKNHMFGKHHSEKTTEKMSIAHINKHPSEETLKKMSLVKSGENHPLVKLNNDKVKQIKFLLWENILSCGEIGKMFGVHHSRISAIKYNRTWKCVGVL
jgi:group I intron endonuclease